MSIHFAGSRRPSASVLARALGRPAWMAAHNDNGMNAAAPAIDTPLLRAALEHFAAHGLAAARTACDRAEAAGATGNADDQHHWMAICRMLDKRLAQRRHR